MNSSINGQPGLLALAGRLSACSSGGGADATATADIASPLAGGWEGISSSGDGGGARQLAIAVASFDGVNAGVLFGRRRLCARRSDKRLGQSVPQGTGEAFCRVALDMNNTIPQPMLFAESAQESRSQTGLGRRKREVAPARTVFCRICRPIVQLWDKKPVKNGPLRPFRSRRSPSPTGSWRVMLIWW